MRWRHLLMLACLMALGLGSGPAHALESPAARSGIIRAIELRGLQGVDPEAVRAVLPFQVGDRYRAAQLQVALTVLQQWGRFVAIDTRIERQHGNYTLIFIFQPARRIEDINFHGHYPYLTRHVRRQLSIHPGDEFHAEQMQAQVDRLTDFYTREGYFNSRARFTAKWKPYTQGMHLDFYITRGQALRWGTLTVTGNTVLRLTRIRSVFPAWQYYSPRRLRAAVRTLARVYHRRGYIKARVRMETSTVDPNTMRMDVALHVTEGPKLKVQLDGNHLLTTSELTRVLTFDREGRFDRYEIESSIKAMQRRYIARGILETHITYDRSKSTDARAWITFHIHEGKRRTIWNVQFSGNTAMPSSTLRDQILTQPTSLYHRGTLDPKLLVEDLEALQEFYQRQGYLDATVGPEHIMNDEADRFYQITIPIQEGAAYHVGTVNFSGNHHARHEELLATLRLQPGIPVDPTAYEEERQALQLYFNDHGYPYATIDLQIQKDPSTTQVHLHYDIQEGTAVKIGQIMISGDFITSQHAIRRALVVKPGDRYSDQRILESQVNLRRLGAFRAVTIERVGLETQQPVVHLAIRVEEERPYLMDFDLGYSTDDKLTGEIRFTNLNSFGWGKRTHLSILGGQERARAELAWIDPRFLNTDLLFTTSGAIDRTKDIAFDLLRANGAMGLYRQYHRTGFVLRYQLSRNRLLGGDPTAADLEGRRDTTISQLTSGITFDTRDNYAQPTRGVYLYAQADLFNELRGQRADFVKITGGANHYWNLWGGIILSQHGRLGGIQKIGEANVPITERLFLGGEDTIRGFAEDGIGPTDVAGSPLGSNVRWIYNAELSFPLFQGFRAATFFDAGSLTESFTALSANDIRESAGFGLRYTTPVGPIRAEYGIKLDPRPGESTGRFHFTFGHIF